MDYMDLNNCSSESNSPENNNSGAMQNNNPEAVIGDNLKSEAGNNLNMSVNSNDLSINESSNFTSAESINFNSVESNNFNSDEGNNFKTAFNDNKGAAVANGYSFYNETYKKSKKNKSNIAQLILVALMSAILGGAVVGVLMQFVLPSVGNTVKSYLGMEEKNSSTLTGTNVSTDVYKRVEIIDDTDYLVSAIAEKVSPSVVGIRVTAPTQISSGFSFFFGGGTTTQQSTSEGSGIIISSDGYIMTNNHVISNAMDDYGQPKKGAKIEVFLLNKLDQPYTAEIIGWDRKTDLAVIKIDAQNLPVAELGNSDEVKVGEPAIAIGTPGGLEFMGSVTFGVISGLNRTVQTEDGKKMQYIQTDAAINPGNSGGALVNAKGQVIGINTVKVAATEFEGLGFAIPINDAWKIVQSLINNTYIGGRAPVLGVSIHPQYTEAIAKRYGWPMGLYVADVTPFSGAYRAGIKANDIIVKFDGQEVKTFEELEKLKNNHQPGDTVEVVVYRDGEYLTLQVTLSEDRG